MISLDSDYNTWNRTQCSGLPVNYVIQRQHPCKDCAYEFFSKTEGVCASCERPSYHFDYYQLGDCGKEYSLPQIPKFESCSFRKQRKPKIPRDIFKKYKLRDKEILEKLGYNSFKELFAEIHNNKRYSIKGCRDYINHYSKIYPPISYSFTRNKLLESGIEIRPSSNRYLSVKFKA